MFWNNVDQTDMFLMTPQMKSFVPADADLGSIGVQNTLTALMSQLMTKELVKCKKMQQMQTCATFVHLMHNWKHCKNQQKGDCFHFFSKALASETISAGLREDSWHNFCTNMITCN